MSLKLKLQHWFTLDTRSLAVMRIGLSFLIFIDLIIRMTSFEWNYTDRGILPLELWTNEIARPWQFSLFSINGSEEFSFFLLLLHCCVAISIALGWKTCFFTAFNALLIISLHNRNPFLQNGGDLILQVVSLLAIFLPWGEIWSIDSRKSSQKISPRLVTGTWVWCFYLTCFVIYFVSFLYKIKNPLWVPEFSALSYAFSNDAFVNPLGSFFGDYRFLMKTATFSILLLESICPTLLLFGFLLPERFGHTLKRSLVCAFVFFHLLISIFLKIGIFPYNCIFMWLAFWPISPLGIIPSKKNLSYYFGGIILFIILTFNLSNIFRSSSWAFFRSVAQRVYLNQSWTMFSGISKEKIGWKLYIERNDGQKIPWTEHLQSHDYNSDSHWRKFFGNMIFNKRLALYYAQAICRMRRSVKSVEVQENKFSITPQFQLADRSLKTILLHNCTSKNEQ